ncbi:MAG: ribonuclease R [Mycoplasma sp.]|nr:ribonuclease R [Mycoplasma sp.]
MNEKKILSVINEQPQNFIALAKKLKIKREDNKILSKFLISLSKDGKIFIMNDGSFIKPNKIKETFGEIRVNPKGFGFVDIEGENSIFIGPKDTLNAFDRDEVVIKYYEDSTDKTKRTGKVIKILKRKTKTLVGIPEKFGKKWGFKTIDGKFINRYRFLDTSKLNENYIIKVKIIEYKPNEIIIDLISTIGHKDDAKVFIQSNIEQSGISWKFPEEVLKEAQKIPNTIDKEEKKGRKDIRERLVITIDGDDTKDFDDAIEVSKLKNGNYILGVHIADVTHYVKEGSFIDEEALKRGTSVYLADRVIPMLPEKLSNGICSLNPNVDRFVVSCEIEINSSGETVSYDIYPAIINSKYRLTYKDVNEFYEGKKKYDNKKLVNMLMISKELTTKIRKYKKEQGYIDFDINESKLVLDEVGKTIDIVIRNRGFSEMMIEDFMVRANETVAEHVASKKLAFIYRIHDKPEMERTSSLTEVLKTLGLNLSIPDNPEPKEFANVIEQLKRKRFDDFLKIMMLRTMSKAIYQKENIGHFGLASKNYTHFTSPIRRYPDLMVHRMLRTYFFDNKPNMTRHFDSILDQIAKSNSDSEQKAIELERKVSDIKKAEFFEKFIGKKLKGQIVSMAKFGFFVEFPNKVDGLVHISSLIDGKYELSKNGFKLKSKTREITIGDTVEVIVNKTNKSEGKIDLLLADMQKQ